MFVCLFFQCRMVLENLVPWPGIKPMLPAVEERILNHRTSEKFLHPFAFNLCLKSVS